LFKRISIYHLERAKSFQPEKILDLIHQLKIDKVNLNKYYKNVDFLEEIFRTIINDEDKTTSQLATLGQRFIDEKKEFFDLSTDIIDSRRNNEKLQDEYYHYLNNTILDYYQNPDLPKGHDFNYDYPIFRKILEKLVVDYRGQPSSNTLTRHLSNACNSAYSMEQINISFIEGIENQIDVIEKCGAELSDFAEELKINLT